LGYHKYSWPEHPEEKRVVPHSSCKSRFCNSCGKVIADQWTKKASRYFPHPPFYHLTFNLSDKLRAYFYLNTKKPVIAETRIVEDDGHFVLKKWLSGLFLENWWLFQLSLTIFKRTNPKSKILKLFLYQFRVSEIIKFKTL